MPNLIEIFKNVIRDMKNNMIISNNKRNDYIKMINEKSINVQKIFNDL